MSNNNNKYRLSDLLSTYKMNSHINKPTRLSTNSTTCIDYICTNFLDDTNKFKCDVTLNGLSDHTAQVLSFDLPQSSLITDNKKRRLFTKSNYEMFRQYVSKETWYNVYSAQTVNDGFREFLGNLTYYGDVCFPFTNIRINIKKCWVTSGIRTSSKKLKLLHKLMITTGSIENKNKYRSYKKVYDKILKRAKRMHYDKFYNKATNKSKAAWTIINEDLGNQKSKSNFTYQLKINDKIINKPQEVANVMNDHFVNLPRNLSAKFSNLKVNNVEIKKEYPTIFIEPAIETEVFNIIMNLKKSNSFGMDNVSANMLKSVVHYILSPLTYLINWSLSEGVFPEDLKIAKIIALHKKGDPLTIDNYRPISLLSSVSKILERTVYNRIIDFCTKHEILCAEQHGFRKGRSTQTGILSFLSELYINLDKNKKCFGVFMDLSKAFDLVNHALLLEKLRKYGLRGKLGGWLESYLSNRQQIVEIDHIKSSKLSISCGVPQGSVLGPLLFVLFINDLPNIVSECHLIMFADDNSLLITKDNHLDLVHNSQEKINTFVSKFSSDKLLLNESKTVFINFTPRSLNYQESFLLRINGQSLEQVKSTKFLGVHIDNALNWECHINDLCKKLSPACFALYRLRTVTNRNILLSYYYAKFYSRIVYGIIFWGGSHYSVRAFRMQKKAVRNIVGVSRRTSCRRYFRELKILPLACLYIMEIVMLVKSNPDKFLRNNHNHHYDTKGQNTLLTPAHSLSLYEKSPYYMGIKLYNKLPDHLKQINSRVKFKNELRTLLLEHVFYNVREFLEFVF